MNRTEYNQAVETYLGLPKYKKSTATQNSYRTALKKFGEFLDVIAMKNNGKDDDISPAIVMEYQTDLSNSGVKDNTINHYLVKLHTFFDYCEDVELITDNPVNLKHTVQFKQADIEYTLLTKKQIDKLIYERPTIYHLNKKVSKMQVKEYAIIMLFLFTGMRNAELRALKLSDLDFKNGAITVFHGKGDKKRVIPFPARAQLAVREYLQEKIRPEYLNDEDYLFGSCINKGFGGELNGNEWKPLSSATIQSSVKKYVKDKVGIDIHPHTLRKAFVAICDDKGVSMRDVQETLGHSSIATTERIYKNVLNTNRAAENINNALNN